MLACKSQYARAAMSSTTPYGVLARSFSPSQAVVTGNCDSQNNKCRFAQSIRAVTSSQVFSKWWWLFQ